MRTFALRGLVVGLLAAASMTACSGPLDRAPKPVQAALDPFLKAGYACAGPTPATEGTFDLYWLAVDPTAQGKGIGTTLVRAVERELRDRGARMLLVETSSRPDYSNTRAFYARCGYNEAARITDFYAPADDRIMLTTRLTQERGAATR